MTQPIQIDEDAALLEFSFPGGHVLSADCLDLLDELVRLDQKSKDLPTVCYDCGHEWPSEEKLDVCPACQNAKSEATGKPNIGQDNRFWDRVADFLKTRYGVPRCSRRGAAQLYDAVVEASGSLKKTSDEPSSLPGTSESTPAAGPDGSNGSGTTG